MPDRYHFHLIGDPGITGWINTIAYFIAVLLCVACARRSPLRLPTANCFPERKFWWALALVLLLLGFNKQLDLQSILGPLSEALLGSHEWDSIRPILQIIFVPVAAMTGILLFLYILFRTWGSWHHHALTLAGIGLIVFYICLRIAMFYFFGNIVPYEFAWPHRWAYELAGIVLIAVSASLHHRRNQAT